MLKSPHIFAIALAALLSISWLVSRFFCSRSLELQALRALLAAQRPSAHKTDFQDHNLTTWMSTLDDSLSLTDLLLPGSHDAAAFNLTRNIMVGGQLSIVHRLIVFGQHLGLPFESITVPWSETQTLSVYDQLRLGVRYLDLRAGWTGTTFVGFHTCSGRPFAEILAEIAQFLEEHPTEGLLIEVGHLFNAGPVERAKLAAMISASLGPFLYPRPASGGPPTLPLAAMRASGRRVVLTFDDPTILDRNTDFWQPDLLYNTWANTDRMDRLWTYAASLLEQHTTARAALTAAVAQPPPALWKLTWTLNVRPRTLGRYFWKGERENTGGSEVVCGLQGPAALPSQHTQHRKPRISPAPARRLLAPPEGMLPHPSCEPVSLSLVDMADFCNSYLPPFLRSVFDHNDHNDSESFAAASLAGVPAPRDPIDPDHRRAATNESDAFAAMPLAPTAPSLAVEGVGPGMDFAAAAVAAAEGSRGSLVLPSIILFDQVESAVEAIRMMISENQRRSERARELRLPIELTS